MRSILLAFFVLITTSAFAETTYSVVDGKLEVTETVTTPRTQKAHYDVRSLRVQKQRLQERIQEINLLLDKARELNIQEES